jgi:hypothetical protein
MSLNDVIRLANSIIDRSLSLADRVESVRQLCQLDPEWALQSVLHVTEDAEEDVAVLKAMGLELDKIAQVHRPLTEFETRDMSDIAYLAYCEDN